ncbi:MAG: ketopantoate reductase family protein [Promethearchaeota archaeon]
MNDKDKFEIVIYGVGAIGASLGGWLTPHYDKIYLLARGDNAKVIKSRGLTLYQKINNNPVPIPVNVIEDINEKPSADIIVIAVKNYDLEEVAKDVFSKLGDKPIIVALQNGVENQKILPKYFTKIIYGIILFNAWQDKPGIFGYRNKGQIILGTIDNSLQSIMEKISQIFNLGIPTKITHMLQEAAHSKMIINLGNSILTLIDFNYNKIDNKISYISKFRKILINMLIEGIKIIQTAGYQEHKLKGLPPWNALKILIDAPDEKADQLFKQNMKEIGINSMMQDIITRGKSQSELESINGYFVKLADSLGIKAPYNKVIYQLCKTQFDKSPFQPLDIKVVWNKINENL